MVQQREYNYCQARGFDDDSDGVHNSGLEILHSLTVSQLLLTVRGVGVLITVTNCLHPFFRLH